MKKQIRYSVFETNSSSVHTVCINKTFAYPISLKTIHFGTGEFGWEFSKYTNLCDKTAYLHEAIICAANDKDKYKELISEFTKLLHNVGIEEVTWETITWEDHDCPDYKSHGYIDHGYELSEVIDVMLKDPSILYGFLFNDTSCVRTGNDNDYPSDFNDDIDYDYEYNKGN